MGANLVEIFHIIDEVFKEVCIIHIQYQTNAGTQSVHNLLIFN